MRSRTGRRAWLRWLIAALAVLLVLVVGLWRTLETEWAEERVRRLIVDRAADVLAADLTIGRLSGSVFGDVTLSDVALSLEGRPVFTAREVLVRFHPWDIVRSRFVLDRMTLVEPAIVIAEDETGWNVTRLTRSGTAASSPRALTLVIDHLNVVRGDVTVQPRDGEARGVSGLSLESSLQVRGDEVDVTVDEGSGRDKTSGDHVTNLRGGVSIRPDRFVIDRVRADIGQAAAEVSLEWPRGPVENGPGTVSASVRSLPAAFIRAWAPAFTVVPTSATIAATIGGPLNALTADWVVSSADGTVTGHTRAKPADGHWALDGRVRVENWNPPAFAGELAGLEMRAASATYDVVLPVRHLADATVRFAVTAPAVAMAGYRATSVRANGTYRDDVVEANGSALAYGARVTTAARFNRADQALAARGTYLGLNLQALPATLGVPAVQSSLSGGYELMWRSGRWSVDTTFARSSLEGAILHEGSAATLGVAGDWPEYRADVRFASLDPARFVTAFPDASGWLTDLSGTIDGEVRLSGAGATLDEISGSADIRLAPSRVAGVEIEDLRATVTVGGHALEAAISGRAAGDVSRMAGTAWPTAGPLSGVLDVSGSVRIPDLGAPIALEDVFATGRVSLADVEAGDARMARLDAEGTLQSGTLTLTALDVRASDLTLTATGPLAVAGDGQSDLSFAVTGDDVSVLATAMGVDAHGSAYLDGRVTGGARRQTVAGSLRATTLVVEAVQVLSLTGTYEVVVPDLDPARAVAWIDSTATFVDVGGRTLDEARSRVGYDAGVVTVDAVLTQGARTLDVSGELRARPEDHEVIVRRLTLENAGRTWTLSRPRATIHYGPGSIAVSDFVVRHDVEEISVGGRLAPGSPDGLAVRLTNVSLDGFAEWLPGAPVVSGQIDADATLSGSPSEVAVTASLSVAEGRVEDVPFRSLVADVSYREARAVIDASLEAGTGARLVVKGAMPIGSRADGAAVPWDLTVTSDAIELGLLGPFIPEAEIHAGIGQFDLHLSGTVPDVNGSIDIRDASFRLPATGVSYGNVVADLGVKGRELTVRALRLTDPGGDVAEVEGTVLAPGGAGSYGFDLRIVTRDFDVLGSALGEAEVSADLQVMGDAETPLVTGTIKVDRARLEVDRILDRFGPVWEPAVAPSGGRAGLHERSSYSITLDLPDNVVARGRGLRTRGGPVDLGDVNVTVGGALSFAKEVNETAAVVGRLDVVRGTYRFQGRPFTIARGSSVQFRGDPFDPALDVDAERTVSGVVTTVHLGGTPARPAISLRSDPPLDEGDVLSLIVFNQSMNRLPTDQRVSLAARAGSLAAGAIATPIADSVADALNLDQFDIQASDTTGGAAVLVGQQVNERLFVGFRHDFGQSDVSQVSFEFRLNEFLSIVTSLAQGGSAASSVRRAEAAGFDLIFVVR